MEMQFIPLIGKYAKQIEPKTIRVTELNVDPFDVEPFISFRSEGDEYEPATEWHAFVFNGYDDQDEPILILLKRYDTEDSDDDEQEAVSISKSLFQAIAGDCNIPW